MFNKPYSESCDQNREVILSVIQPVLASSSELLEIGSGTGQHAVYFSEYMPHLQWQTSDRKQYHDGIIAWIEDSDVNNVAMPIELDVTTSEWPQQRYDAVFTANTLHIMSDEDTTNFFTGVGRVIKDDADLLVYGPFNYAGRYTSESNERFDAWLKSRDIQSGIKDFEFIELLASDNGMSLIEDHAMPANNRILHFRK